MINLLSGEYRCCGTLCDKYKAQSHLDKIKQIINEASELLAKIEQLKSELDNE